MASLKPSNILIFGATGTIGKFITEKIISADPPFKHITIFTSANTAGTKGDLLGSWKAAGNVSVVTGDIDSDADVSAAYEDHAIDTVVSAVGRGAIDKQVGLVRLAEQAGGVRWFFPSEFGTDVEYGPASRGEKPHQKKLALRDYVRGEVRRLRVTYVVTGPYFEMWVRGQPGLEVAGRFDVKNKEAHLVDEGEGKVGFTTMPDVGKLVVAAMHNPEAAAGKALKVNSFEATPKQVLAEYEKQTGAKWKVSSTPLSKVIELENSLWEQANPRATTVTLRRIWAEGGTLYEKTDNESIGLKPEDMESLAVGVKRDLESQ